MAEVRKSVIVSAPGKIILHGEHAVVYGKKAVATGLNLRTVLRLSPNPEQDKQTTIVRFPNIDITREWKLTDLNLLAEFLPKISCDSPDINEEAVRRLKRSVKEDIMFGKSLKGFP